MTTIIGGSSPSITFSDSTTQTTAALPLTGGQLSGNLTFASGTNGIIFNNSSALTNSTLNDYELGTWTPIINGANQPTCLYVKIGRLVTISGDITLSFTGSPNGIMTGLPFSVQGGAQFGSAMPYQSNSASTVTMLITNAGTANFYNGQTTQLFLSTSARIIFTVSYEASF
jgi:hypothetical protein